ncbi:MAG TPA: hypothetical protein VF676_13090 [Flavobacterium sp.]|jgi:uncharacterized membrane protein HdeD (DUF308 family)
MKELFSITYYFWVFTRIIFVIAGFVSVAGTYGTYRMSTLELLANLVLVVYLFLMGYNTVSDFSSSSRNTVPRYISGAISIILGLAVLALVFTTNVVSVIVAFIFSFWIILLGIFDLLLIRKNNSADDES